MKAVLARIVALVRKYPARAISLTAAAVVFAAAKLGVVVPEQTVAHALEFVVPILVGGEATHRKVSPA